MGNKRRETSHTTKTFANRLSELIINCGKSYDEVSADTGITKSGLSDYVNDKRSPKLEAICALSEYFNVSVDYLLGKTDIPSVSEDIKSVHEYTGLSQEAICFLHERKESDIAGSKSVFANHVSDFLCVPGFDDAIMKLYAANATIDSLYGMISAYEAKDEVTYIDYRDEVVSYSADSKDYYAFVVEKLFQGWTSARLNYYEAIEELKSIADKLCSYKKSYKEIEKRINEIDKQSKRVNGVDFDGVE